LNAADDAAGIPAAWRAVALAPPRAGGPAPVRGVLKAQPGDFRVEEILGFAPDGGAAHRLLQVEKTDANTLYVARLLAREAGLRPPDVGFAGLKDRRAVATQWFSVPVGRVPREWAGFEGPGFRVLAALPHSRKLRRGALAGNRFAITLRQLEGDLSALPARLARLAAEGVPNYFGPQRFGREAANLGRVLDWLQHGRLASAREERGFVFSAARALAFNAVLAARVEAGSWNRLLPGEVVSLDGSASVFAAAAIDAALTARCESFDVHPSGPLPGRGGLQPGGEAAAVETATLAAFTGLPAALEAAGVDAARRALRVRPVEVTHSLDGNDLNVGFTLPRGAFATVVLREAVDFDPADSPGDDD
jgi:tRNA pseudouridine13 synthase